MVYLLVDASAKTLGLNISYDLKWNCHIDSINKKAEKHLYSLSQLIRFGLPLLVRSRSIHVLSSLTVYPRTFTSSLKASNAHHFSLLLTKLSYRRQELFDKVFYKIIPSEQNKLHNLLPARNTDTLNLRSKRNFRPVFKTKTFRNSLDVLKD